jgi:putative transcriptional regulator
MEAKLLKPSLLVAAPQMTDPNFNNTVILLVEHTVEGAFGVIVNRPTKVPMKTLIDTDIAEIPDSVPAWTGGPVAPDNGLILCQHLDGKILPKEKLCDGVILSASPAALSAIAQYAEGFREENIIKGQVPNRSPNHPFRFLVGYAGWGAGQLDEELRNGGWIELPLSFEILYYTPWQTMWQSAISSLGISPAKLVPSLQEYLN